jgi:hypothetical protein
MWGEYLSPPRQQGILLYIFGEGFVVTEKLGKNIIGLWSHRVSACVP